MKKEFKERLKVWLKKGLELKAEIDGEEITRFDLKIDLVREIFAFALSLTLSIIAFVFKAQIEHLIVLGIHFAFWTAVTLAWVVIAVLRLIILKEEVKK